MARGRDAGLVRRHRGNGTVSSNRKKNVFIDVGSIKDVHIPALHQVYGTELCESSLRSFKTGKARLFVCDCHGTRSHDLPETSGPNDMPNWDEVMNLSRAAKLEALEKLKNRRG